MGYRKYQIQLKDHVTGEAIVTSGGVCQVCTEDSPAKATIYSDKDGTSASNPIALTRGRIEFFTADTVDAVDIYVHAPSGHFVPVYSVKPMGPNEIYIDTGARHTTIVIPFSMDDLTANTETDTGFDLGTSQVVEPDGIGVKVTTLDTSETIDVGTLSTESSSTGDADGLIDGISLAATGVVLATVGYNEGTNTTFIDVTGGDQEFTLGAHVAKGTEEGANTNTDEGFYLLQPYVPDTTRSISLTVSAGTDTAEGFIFIPTKLYNTT